MWNEFEEYLRANDIKLTTTQEETAKELLNSTVFQVFITDGLGSGKSFLLGHLERFGKSLPVRPTRAVITNIHVPEGY